MSLHQTSSYTLTTSSSSTVWPRPRTVKLHAISLNRSRCSQLYQTFGLAAVERSQGAQGGRRNATTVLASNKANSPDLDDLQLDESYYDEIGMTREESVRQQREMLYSIDPDAVTLDDLASVDSSQLPDEWRKAIENLQVYGPQALVMAGFRAEEYAVARTLLDSLGAHDVKVLPASQDMLQSPLAVALQETEIDWSAPRPPHWIMGGAWGSQRTILFSGLSVKVQATILELLEAQGLPQQICVTMALEDDQHRKLGEIMAEAVKAQRSYSQTAAPAPWEVPKHNASSSSSSGGNSSSTTGSSSSGGSSSTTGSSSSSKKGFLSGLPGKRGPLFARKTSGSSSSSGKGAAAAAGRVPDEGLEALQDLISPEMAKARLQASASANPGLTDLLDLEIPTDETEAAAAPQQQQPWQQLQQLTSDINSSSSSNAQQTDAQSKALLDWVTDESTGQFVELPWSDNEPAAAAPASSVSYQQQQRQSDVSDLDMSISPLDEILPSTPPPSAAAASSSSSSSSFWKQQQGGSSSNNSLYSQTAAASDDIDDLDLSGPTVLATIQAALQSGVDPEKLKELIDQAAAASAAAADPVDLLIQEDERKAAEAAATAAALKASSSSSRLRTGNADKATAADRTDSKMASDTAAAAATAPFGPAPPPPGSSSADQADGLLKLRPEIERAFENNQIKFVDMTKLPSKYRKQYTLAAMQERQRQQQQLQQQLQQQQQEEGFAQQLADINEVEQQQQQLAGEAARQQQQRWWQQQQQQRSQQQQAMLQGLSSSVAGSLPKGKLIEMEVEGGEAMQQGVMDENDMLFNDDDTPYDNMDGFDDSATEDESAETESDEALYLDETLLQQLVASAQLEGLDVDKTLAQALAYGVTIDADVAAAVGVQLPGPEMVEEATREIVSSLQEMQEQDNDNVHSQLQNDNDEDGDGSEGVIDVPATTLEPRVQGSSATASSGSRQWGSGLSAAVGRAKARLAEKKRIQQHEQ